MGMPKRIIYQANEVEAFDMDRFLTSLRKYGEIDTKDVEKALNFFDPYDPLHVSCLVEVGAVVLDEDAGQKYYNDHEDRFHKAPGFDRLRRITGYLVGSLERWNDGKKAEEKVRVKHNVGKYDKAGQYSQDKKDAIEAEKQKASLSYQI